MFPQFGAGNSSVATARPSLVSFKAGKMKHEEKPGGKYLVTPELQKGLISLVRGDDQLIHFQWSNRQVETAAAPVDDFIIFPQDCSFSKVNTGKEQDRVYLLQYTNSARRFFFWMQDKKKDQDESNATKLNDLMNNPPQANEPTGTAGVGPNGQMDQNALLQMLGALPGSSSAPAGGTNESTNAPAVVQMADLQNILQNMGMAPAPAPAEETTEVLARPSESPQPLAAPRGSITTNDLQQAMALMLGQQSSSIISLTTMLTTIDNMGDVFQDDHVVQLLVPLLPPTRQTLDELKDTILSPPFRQGIQSLQGALRSGNFNAILANFGLDPKAAETKLAQGDFVGAFLDAIQHWADTSAIAQ